MFSSSQSILSFDIPDLPCTSLKLDQRDLSTIEVKNSYSSELSTFIQLQYIEVRCVEDSSSEDEDTDTENTEVKEYTEYTKNDEKIDSKQTEASFFLYYC